MSKAVVGMRRIRCLKDEIEEQCWLPHSGHVMLDLRARVPMPVLGTGPSTSARVPEDLY